MSKAKKWIIHKEETKMDNFLIFYAPILVVIVSIIVAFWISIKDEAIK
jgi:hypothetical protein